MTEHERMTLRMIIGWCRTRFAAPDEMSDEPCALGERRVDMATFERIDRALTRLLQGVPEAEI